MVGLLAWAFVAFGFTLIVTTSRLFRPLRELAERRTSLLGVLLHCPMCFGFWAGALLTVAGFFSPSVHLCPQSWPLVVRAWADGCAASGLCWCVHVVLVRLGASDL